MTKSKDWIFEESVRLHKFYRGKYMTVPKCCIRDFNDFAFWYTPGVARPCQQIHDDPEKVFEMTNKGNTIAVITNGTRVLGLGDIGPEASLPVMEGKSLLFKHLGGVDAVPICLDTKDPDRFIDICKALQPSFGGFNLEDIQKPDCFRILDTLRRECHIPVWHDDQQGTAAVTVAGLINALKLVGKEMGKVRVVLVGSGAANVCIARLMFSIGVDPKATIMVDRKGTLNRNRTELEKKEPIKWELAQTTNADNVEGGIGEAMKGADVVIALSRSRKSVDETPVILPEWIKAMAPKAIVFACANPIPEILPQQAKDAGAAIVATGRSDFPNQVNNSLGFPGIFRGTLDVMAKTITDEMCIVAAEELARYQEKRELLDPEHIIPSMDDREVFPREAAAVGAKAVEQGVARLNLTQDEIFKMASERIEHAHKQTKVLMDSGIIKLPK